MIGVLLAVGVSVSCLLVLRRLVDVLVLEFMRVAGIPTLSEIVTTTLYNRSRMIADNVTDNNALLAALRKNQKLHA